MGKKGIFLFVALLLPGVIFVFLKLFGKNEFAVEPLFQKEKPAAMSGCGDITLPYRVDAAVVKEILPERDSLVLIWFVKDATASSAAATEMGQLKTELAGDPVGFVSIDRDDQRFTDWYDCRFLMRGPLDAVIVDKSGVIRGQYELEDRDEADRLRTEVTILLKKY